LLAISWPAFQLKMCNHVHFPLSSSRWLFGAQGERTLLGILLCFYLFVIYKILYSNFLFLVSHGEGFSESIFDKLLSIFFAMFGFGPLRHLFTSYPVVVQLNLTVVL
jgi:hypothetical protein